MNRPLLLLFPLMFLPFAFPLPEVSFEFSSLEGWRAGNNVAELIVKDGFLMGRCIGPDPSIVSPLFDLEASNRHLIEIRMRSTKEGWGQIYWSGTTEPPYEGFRPNKYNPFYIKGDNEFHTYKILPFWEGEGRIIHIRLDLPDDAVDAEFAIDYIRIERIQGIGSTNWFIGGEGMKLEKEFPDKINIKISSDRAPLISLSPPFKGEDNPIVSLPLRIQTAKMDGYAELVWMEDGAQKRFAFDILPDNKTHFYNIVPSWRGIVSSLCLVLHNVSGSCEVGRMEVGKEPRGKELQEVYFGIDGLGRAGKQFPLVLQLKNGGLPLGEVKVRLHLPSGLKLVKGENPQVARKIDFGEPLLFQWEAIASKEGKYKISVDVQYDGQSFSLSKVVEVTPAPKVERMDYPPPPIIPKTDWEVGVYYFPGWRTASQWTPVKNWGRKPLLGYYKEGEPEVMDWQIKWALEHGITFFIFDWYWVQGARSLEHALHEAFLRCRYGKMMKFALLWANHNPPRTSSREDLLNLTRFCIDNYFRLPNYLRIDNKPVLFIFTPRRLTEDMGSPAVKSAFDEMREMCKREGLNGLFIVGCMHNWDVGLEDMRKEGYDAVSGYNYPWVNAGENKRSPYKEMAEGFKKIWSDIVSKGFDYIVPTTPGWDPRPWHGTETTARVGSTSQLFKEMLLDAKDFVEKHNLRRMVIIEAWNEWGEGSYIEPSREWGFAYLDAVREVFLGKDGHQDLVPQDIGLPLKEAEVPHFRGRWDFEKTPEGWTAMMGVDIFKVEDGCLYLHTSTNDPAIVFPPVAIKSKDYRRMLIRMKVDKGNIGQVFWSNTVFSMSEFTSERFKLITNGEFHTYELDLSKNPAWKGTILSLRFDPTDASDANVYIDYVALER